MVYTKYGKEKAIVFTSTHSSHSPNQQQCEYEDRVSPFIHFENTSNQSQNEHQKNAPNQIN